MRYRDLLLDIWVDGTGAVRLEDEDEMEAAVAAVAAVAAGQLMAHEHRRLHCLREFFWRRAVQLTERVDVAIAASVA